MNKSKVNTVVSPVVKLLLPTPKEIEKPGKSAYDYKRGTYDSPGKEAMLEKLRQPDERKKYEKDVRLANSIVKKLKNGKATPTERKKLKTLLTNSPLNVSWGHGITNSTIQSHLDLHYNSDGRLTPRSLHIKNLVETIQLLDGTNKQKFRKGKDGKMVPLASIRLSVNDTGGKQVRKSIRKQ